MSNNGAGYESRTVPPGAVFIATGQPLVVFPSLAAAQNALAASDVAEWTKSAAYGPNGEVHRVRCQDNRVLIEPTGEPDRPDELKGHLLWHLEECEDPADANQPLAEVVAIAWAIERDYHLRCDPSGNRIGSHIPVWGYAAGALTLGALWYFWLG